MLAVIDVLPAERGCTRASICRVLRRRGRSQGYAIDCRCCRCCSNTGTANQQIGRRRRRNRNGRWYRSLGSDNTWGLSVLRRYHRSGRSRCRRVLDHGQLGSGHACWTRTTHMVALPVHTRDPRHVSRCPRSHKHTSLTIDVLRARVAGRRNFSGRDSRCQCGATNQSSAHPRRDKKRSEKHDFTPGNHGPKDAWSNQSCKACGYLI